MVEDQVRLDRVTVKGWVSLREATVEEQVSLDGATVRHVTNCHDSAGTSYPKPPTQDPRPKKKQGITVGTKTTYKRAGVTGFEPAV